MTIRAETLTPQGAPPTYSARWCPSCRALVSDSKVFCVLFNDKMVEEVVPLIQMGLAVYLDKPIVLLVPQGAVVPINLRRLATKIAEFDPASEDSLRDATRKVLAVS